jgi:AraC-like DNA-binding protein
LFLVDVHTFDPFVALHVGRVESRANSDYFYDNRERGLADEAVIQQTLGGAGFFRDSTGRRLAPAGHAMMFTHRETSSYGYPPEATESYHFRYLSFKLSGLRPWFDHLRAEFGSVVLMEMTGEASTLFEDVLRRFRDRSFRDRFQPTELLQQLLIALHREQIKAAQSQDPIEYGRHYLQDHFRSPINLKVLAKKCGVSREHLIRSFTRRYGEPPGEFLRRLRMEHAQRLLHATKYTLQDIALDCGYTDANTFCRAYRLRYGHSPRAHPAFQSPG